MGNAQNSLSQPIAQGEGRRDGKSKKAIDLGWSSSMLFWSTHYPIRVSYAEDHIHWRRKRRIHHAVMLDPLTSAVCTLDQVRSMVDEMAEAQARWLPKWMA